MEIYEQGASRVGLSLHEHMARTFLWMFLGVGITFAVAAYLNFNPMLMYEILFSFPMMSLVLMVAQIVLVMVLVVRLTKMSPTTAKLIFIGYSALTGVTFSFIGLAYDLGTIGMAFGMAGLYFGSLAVIGFTTKRDLTKIGTMAFAALFALIIYAFISMLFNLEINNFLFSIVGLLIFSGLTAWDVQKSKALYQSYQNDEVMLRKLSIYSALQLYLDFINIFLFILRIVGGGRK